MPYRRLYNHDKLITWTQDRCKCGRFLGRRQRKHCTRCAKKLREERERQRKEYHRRYASIHNFEYYENHRDKILEQKKEYGLRKHLNSPLIISSI